MNLTQAQLAQRANSPARPILGLGTVSRRTISSIEKKYEPNEPNEPRPGFSPHTAEALAIAFDLEPESEGWNEFMEAYRAHRDDTPEPATSTEGEEAPPPLFVVAGREKHLSRLERAIDAAVAGTPGVLFVGANPGTGKTSLIAHAARQAVKRHPELAVLWGDCTSRSVAADPIQPFRQAINIMSGNVDAANPGHLVSGTNRERILHRRPHALNAIATEGRGLIHRFIQPEALKARLNHPGIDPALRERLTALAETPASALNGTDFNEQVFRTLAHYAASGPVILVLEDLHWADTGTSTLIFHLVRRLYDQNIPLLVIGSYRTMDLDINDPADRAPFQPILGESTRFFVDPIIDLSDAVGGPPGRAYVDAIIESRLKSAPEGLGDIVFGLTEGLPLFVGAIMRWYEEEQAATGRTGSDTLWQPDLSRLPTEIDALFANLINRLPPHLQSMLESASVQGANFSAEVLQQVAGITRDQLIEDLDKRLVRRFHIASPSGVHYVSGTPVHTYQFIHALLRDYLYHRLTDLERAHLHEATTTAMIALYGEDPGDASARIAFHFEQAGMRKEAGRHYLWAGNHALDSYDYARAKAMFARIQELDLITIDPFPPIQGLVGLGNCARGEHHPDLAQRYLDDALILARHHNLPFVRANALTSLGMLDFDAGNMRQGAKRLGQAVNALFEFGDRAEASRSLSLLSLTLHGIGHYDEAAQRAARALELARELDNDILITGALIALGNCCLDTGQYARAIALYNDCLVICQDLENTHRMAICWLNLSLCHLETGNLSQASEALAKVYEQGDRVHARLLGAAEYNSGLLEELGGNLRKAQAHYRRSLELREQAAQTALQIDSQAGLLRIALAQDQEEEVDRLLELLSTAISERGIEGIEHLGRLFTTLAQAWGATGRPDLARQAVVDGIAMIHERARLIADPAVRACYLKKVPTNRTIVQLAEAVERDQAIS